MTAVAYFIGGPLDLQKREVERAADVYTLETVSLDHVYAGEPIYIRGQDTRQHFVFVYQGERCRA